MGVVNRCVISCTVHPDGMLFADKASTDRFRGIVMVDFRPRDNVKVILFARSSTEGE